MNPRHLSPSALEGWDWCPVHRYAATYRDRKKMTPNVPVWFGQAVHYGLEAAYRSQDWEMVFVRSWRQLHRELEEAQPKQAEGTEDAAIPTVPSRSIMAMRGLHLIQSALDLKLDGEPEWAFETKLAGLDVPVKGRIDLVDPIGQRIYDWKTTQRGWTANMAAKKVWQPALYTAAYEAKYASRPTFAYVILPVMGSAGAYILEAPRTPESQLAAIARAQEILARIRLDDYGECVCPPAYRPKAVAA